MGRGELKASTTTTQLQIFNSNSNIRKASFSRVFVLVPQHSKAIPMTIQASDSVDTLSPISLYCKLTKEEPNGSHLEIKTKPKSKGACQIRLHWKAKWVFCQTESELCCYIASHSAFSVVLKLTGISHIPSLVIGTKSTKQTKVLTIGA